MQLSQKHKTFFHFFASFLKSSLNFKHFNKKDDPHRFCISEITDSKSEVRQMCKKCRFRGTNNKQHGQRAIILLKSASQQFHHIFWSRSRQLSIKKFLWLTCQILGLLVNTLTADDEYPVLNREKLSVPVQMQLSQKEKTFSEFFAAFLRERLNLGHFEKKYDLHRFTISEITDSAYLVR